MKTHNICKICELEKEISLFVKNRKVCISCLPIYQSQSYERNKDSHIKYYEGNKKEISVQRKEERDKNPDKVKARNKKNYDQNKVDISRKRKERRKNKPEVKQRENELHSIRIKNDPAFKLRKRVSTAIWAALNSNDGSKNSHSVMQYLPYIIEELKYHLELQFESWMTWDNWASFNPITWKDDDSSTWVWNIDHIIPQSKLPYTSMEDDNFKKCWALSNLRPYSAKQNIIDGARKEVLSNEVE